MQLMIDRAKNFIQSDIFGGILLCFCALLALLIANSPFYHIHQYIFEHNFFTVMGRPISGHFVVNEILMSFFFLQVGIELRHEIKYGALAERKKALLPAIAALGGVVAPALIYLSLNHNANLIRGWAIPTATDIAFALGIYALLQHKFHKDLRVILLSIAIIDDILAILIIAIFYSTKIALLPLFCAFLLIVSFYFVAQSKLNRYATPLYFVALWFAFFKAGIHPTLSGVIIGLLAKAPEGESEALKQIVTFIIMPIFSIVNATISFNSINLHNLDNIFLILGIMAALLLGKPLGIYGAAWLGIKTKLCELPKTINAKEFLFIAILSGIGFTMALFTINLSFTHIDAIQSAKIGVTFGSLLAAIAGLGYGYATTKR